MNGAIGKLQGNELHERRGERENECYFTLETHMTASPLIAAAFSNILVVVFILFSRRPSVACYLCLPALKWFPSLGGGKLRKIRCFVAELSVCVCVCARALFRLQVFTYPGPVTRWIREVAVERGRQEG